MILYDPAWLWPLLGGLLLLVALLGFQRLDLARAARPGFRYAAALLELLAAAAALIGGLSLGIWQPSDAGLTTPDWASLGEWLPGYALGMALWICLLFAPAWRQRATEIGSRKDRAVVLFARLARDETLLAMLRAALAPALGLYWAAWLAVALRLGVRGAPERGVEGQAKGARATLLLNASLDLAATVTVIMSGSAWVALALRVLLCVIARGVRALLSHKTRPAATPVADGSETDD